MEGDTGRVGGDAPQAGAGGFTLHAKSLGSGGEYLSYLGMETVAERQRRSDVRKGAITTRFQVPSKRTESEDGSGHLTQRFLRRENQRLLHMVSQMDEIVGACA
jgi:hypothetical protein